MMCVFQIDGGKWGYSVRLARPSGKSRARSFSSRVEAVFCPSSALKEVPVCVRSGRGVFVEDKDKKKKYHLHTCLF